MNRKQRRTLNKVTKNKEATSSIDLMLGMENQCLTCHKSFDRFSKEMAMTWYVEIYKTDKKVNLYCPECYPNRSQNGI